MAAERLDLARRVHPEGRSTPIEPAADQARAGESGSLRRRDPARLVRIYRPADARRTVAEKLAHAARPGGSALAQLEAEGQILRGQFTPGTAETEWCHRRLLARIHRLTIGRLRREIEPVTTADFLRFLPRWQHVAPGTQLHGVDGMLQIIRQLQGYEISGRGVGIGDPAAAHRQVTSRNSWISFACRAR